MRSVIEHVVFYLLGAVGLGCLGVMAWDLAFNQNRCTRTSKRREQRRWCSEGLVEVVRMQPVAVPYPVDAEHPPADFEG